MNKTWRWWAAWILALLSLVLLAVASVLLFLYASWRTNVEVETGAFWLDALVNMGAPVLGLLVALRQPKNRYGWLWLVYGLSAALISIADAIYHMHGGQPNGYPPLIGLLLWSYVPFFYISLLCAPLFALWFPTGRPPTPRWRFLHWWLAIDLILFLPIVFSTGIGSWFTVAIENPLGFVPREIASFTTFIGFFSLIFATLLAAVSVFFRYRSAGRVERQQIKWFLLGGTGLASIYVLSVTPPAHGLWWKIYNDAMLLLVYGTIGIAILRHRLYDIDILIRKTLVWGALTVLLGLVYLGGVTVLQALFSAISNNLNFVQAQSPISIVISTLAIAALFNPLRRQVQAFVDQRFYRKKYNAEQALASFAALAREEVDLEEIRDRLLGVIEETVQPESVSIWLKPAAVHRPSNGVGGQPPEDKILG